MNWAFLENAPETTEYHSIESLTRLVPKKQFSNMQRNISALCHLLENQKVSYLTNLSIAIFNFLAKSVERRSFKFTLIHF